MRQALALVVLSVVVVTSSADENPLFSGTYFCNNQTIPSGDPYLDSVVELVNALEVTQGYAQEVTAAGGPVAYGESQCNDGMSYTDCVACLIDILNNIFTLCDYAIGAQFYSNAGCFLRYEQYQFY